MDSKWNHVLPNVHMYRLWFSVKNEYCRKPPESHWHRFSMFLCRSRTPLVGSQTCAVLLSASDPGGPTGLRNGHLALDSTRKTWLWISSISPCMVSRELKCMKNTITMLHDTIEWSNHVLNASLHWICIFWNQSNIISVLQFCMNSRKNMEKCYRHGAASLLVLDITTSWWPMKSVSLTKLIHKTVQHLSNSRRWVLHGASAIRQLL